MQAIQEALAIALEHALQIGDEARRNVLLRPLRAAIELAERTTSDPHALVAAVQLAMQPAVVLATEGNVDPGLAPAIADAFSGALALARRDRLAEAPPAKLVDELHEITRGAPRVVSLARDVWMPAADAPPESEITLVTEASPESTAEADADEPEPREREPFPEWRETEGVIAEGPPVTLAKDRVAIAAHEWSGRVVDQALDKLAAKARDRRRDPFGDIQHTENQALALLDAIFACGGGVVARISAWWIKSTETLAGSATWAATLALACIEGPDALAAVRAGIEASPPNALAHAELCAEALAIAQHPSKPALAHDLVESPHPLARAVGVDMLARLGQLGEAELRGHVLDAAPPVTAAALRAIGRLAAKDAATLAPLLERWLHHPEPAIAWLASAPLLAWQRPAPIEELRRGGPLAKTLGPRAIEVFVQAGDSQDLAAMQALVRKVVVSADVLDALGRFGHPGVWSFLLHHLADEERADPAAAALETIFGERVAADQRFSASAWKAAITATPIEVGARLLHGEPWRPGALSDLLRSGLLSRVAIQPRADELRARLGLDIVPDLALWSREAAPQLAAFTAAAARHDTRWSPSGWPR